MIPTIEEAEELVNDALKCNPGPWGNHSRVAAHCAKAIAHRCNDLDEDKAYVFGLLHDIGRKFGVRHLGHVSDGYSYMKSFGYDEVAQICLTHSFHNLSLDDYIRNVDTTKEETELIKNQLKLVQITDYDRLIQLCDALAGSQGVLNIEERMLDVKKRYGNYPQSKWDANMNLLKYFAEKADGDIYVIVEKDTYRPINNHD